MLNDNAPANNPQECLSECKSWVGCKFWDFGDGFCRLRSSDGNGAEVAVGYVFGSGNCFFGKLKFVSYLKTSYLIYTHYEICGKYFTSYYRARGKLQENRWKKLL